MNVISNYLVSRPKMLLYKIIMFVKYTYINTKFIGTSNAIYICFHDKNCNIIRKNNKMHL